MLWANKCDQKLVRTGSSLHFHHLPPLTPRPKATLPNSIFLGPFLCSLLPSSAVLTIFFSNTLLHGILRTRFTQHLSAKAQHVRDLGRRLPRVGAQQAQAHLALFVIGHVGVVYFCFEAQLGRLKGIVGGQVEGQMEFAALTCARLARVVLQEKTEEAYGKGRVFGPVDHHFPVVQV